jgi:hypothetical protein
MRDDAFDGRRLLQQSMAVVTRNGQLEGATEALTSSVCAALRTALGQPGLSARPSRIHEAVYHIPSVLINANEPLAVIIVDQNRDGTLTTALRPLVAARLSSRAGYT